MKGYYSITGHSKKGYLNQNVASTKSDANEWKKLMIKQGSEKVRIKYNKSKWNKKNIMSVYLKILNPKKRKMKNKGYNMIGSYKIAGKKRTFKSYGYTKRHFKQDLRYFKDLDCGMVELKRDKSYE